MRENRRGTQSPATRDRSRSGTQDSSSPSSQDESQISAAKDAEGQRQPSTGGRIQTAPPETASHSGPTVREQADQTVTDVARTQDSTATQPDRDQSATIADSATPGQVSLVGAGPGDPELLTRRAWNRLQEADVVLYDSLTGDDILTDIPDRVEQIDVGKRPPDRTSQSEINDLMCTRAGQGDHVVRLKGGDPNVFGRGGEEAEYLASENVSFEIVSGISSVLAASGVSAIPLTHRNCSSSLTVITGHQTPDKAESAIDWPAIADTIATGGTLVVLMGVSKLPENVDALLDHGVPADTAVAMIEKATWNDERVVSGTLETIVERSHTAAIEPPAVTIVGEVVDVRDGVHDQHRR